ncbi:MAG: AAA family ATPase [Candidatus Altimarinota bacterium]
MGEKVGTDMGVLSEGRELQVLGAKTKVSYFREKYAGKIHDTLEIETNHPFLSELKKGFDKEVISQDKAKDALSQAVLDSILRLGNPKGPLGVFFFHGPTGVGKTEMVKALAEIMFGDSGAFIKVNCENFSDRYTGSNLFGAPKGYIGYDEEPYFTNKKVTAAYDNAKTAKKLNPMLSELPWFNIVLFDEIEKAHPQVIQQLLGMLDEGKVQTSKGEVVNFQNSIIILTSNIGQAKIADEKSKNSIGFTQKKIEQGDIEKIFKASLKEIFQPEFIGRIHSFIEFEELSKDDCIQIIDVQVNKFNEYLLKYYAESHIQFELSPSVYEYVLKKGFSKEKGARELVRTFNTSVKRYLTRLLHSSGFKKYYDYRGEVLIGVDIDDQDELRFEMILNPKDTDSENMVIKEIIPENGEISLERLHQIYATMSAYIELHYLSIDDDEIDLKDELTMYADRLKQFGLNQKDIVSLKHNAFLAGLRDLSFLQDFQEIVIEEDENLFAPYEPRTILKLVEHNVSIVYNQNPNSSKKKFIVQTMKGVVNVVEKIMRLDELSSKQTAQILIYIRKILLEKYGIHNV